MSTPQSDPQLLALAHSWAANWSSPTGLPTWLSLYSSSATYTDHPFLVRVAGHDNIGAHWTIWRASHPDFSMTVVDSWPAKELDGGKKAFTFRTHNTGTFVKDLPKRKATGERFWFYGVVDFVVGVEGKIEGVNEWYSTDFSEVKEGLGEYRTRGEFKDEV
ncbi:hypothetical protein EJ04DRAFT_567396 [Polyplosphaeria fusca]|uniref:SnoaL-like domain-containing protein n=1 Tax=Polyplosphaeria fusca TaxID=682080 RepID=A0A9P4QSF0_9PLEO|nr:hypothetical protein EJ04DRAFT_567396 [Polyplosphaeria fusca]